MVDYGSLVTELHIIVYTPKGYTGDHRFPYNLNGLPYLKIGRNVYVYPTRSARKSLFFKNAFNIGSKIIEKRLTETGSENPKATDVKKIKAKKNTVIRSIFEKPKTADLNILRGTEDRSEWLITAQDPFETGFVGLKLKKKYKAPLQIQAHTDFLSRYFWRESFKNKIRVLMAERLLKQADCIRVVSNRIKESLQKTKLVGSKIPISVLPIYTEASSVQAPTFTDITKEGSDSNLADLHVRYPSHNFIILMASRLTREKNIPLALKAMKLVVKHFPGALLVIVGDGPEKKELQAFAKPLGGNVVFEPWTANLNLYYQTADLFLLTSNYEGYGRTVVEAQLAGLPAVMTDVGCAGDIVRDGEGVVVVPVNNVKLLARRIEELVENQEFREKLREGAKQVAKRLLQKEEYLAEYKKSWTSCKLQ